MNFRLLKIVVVISFIINMAACKNKNLSDPFISLEGTWDFKYVPSVSIGSDSLFYKPGFDISSWQGIKVPGHWELQGFTEPMYGGRVKEGTGLYRTSFEVPSKMKGQQIWLKFEGVLYGYDLYVNGNYAGNWSSSYNPASFNITGLVNFSKENLIAVRVNTRAKGYKFDTNDCWGLSGIYRNVFVYSTPGIYIDDYTVTTNLNGNHSAAVNVSIDLKDLDGETNEGLVIDGVLHYPGGQSIKNTIQVKNLTGNQISFNVNSPELWNAESPTLYKLELSLSQDGVLIQKKQQNVGIREVSIENAVLKLNGKPIKLRGINHHDLDPYTGRTLSGEQIITDLDLIRKANINFIRTAHYPPDPKLLDLCDSLGFYVVCEVPFGGGDRHLTDTTYQDILLTRAKATLLRDKNHPSIIIWSVGNENALTPIADVTGRYVQKADTTRPMCYPQMGRYFNAEYKNFPGYIDIYTPHYQKAGWLKQFAKETTKPVIPTEYVHAMGLSFGHLGGAWKEMFRNEKIAGGAIWLFQDQGIARKAEKPVNRNELTHYAWVDSLTYFDTQGNKGADGIVYADRTPQVDYWQVRKVYSPVQIIEKELTITSGKQDIEITTYNQYDFTNLKLIKGEWELFKNKKVIQSGVLDIDCAPHDTVTCSLPVSIPGNPGKDVYIIKLNFSDKDSMPIYEHSVSLVSSPGCKGVKDEIVNGLAEHEVVSNQEGGMNNIGIGDINYQVSTHDFSVELADNKTGRSILDEGIFVRTGRKPKITDLTIRDYQFKETRNYYWDPFLLKPDRISDVETNKSEDNFSMSGIATLNRGGEFPHEKITGEINYAVSNKGVLAVKYKLKPINASGVLLEAGVSFMLPKDYNNFMWLGDGPYCSYPDKYELNDFGFHLIKKGDINFSGNRSNVEIALVCDSVGNGIVLLGERANISVEVINGKIVVSHNALLTGLSNKKTLPEDIVHAGQLDHFSGEFRLVSVRADEWPEKLQELFNYPDNSIKPFNPFYYSYDYSE